MKTLILPGYSLSNRPWAEEVKKTVDDSSVHEWKHWITGEQKDFSVKSEVAKVLNEIGESRVNIIAKSIGTLVAATLVKEIAHQLNKVILCGVPNAFLEDNDLEDKPYFNLKSLNPENILVIQNDKDPLASYNEVKEMFSKINPKIKIIKKDRGDHNYSYYSDFKSFLLG